MKMDVFQQAASTLCENLIRRLEDVPEQIRKTATEIRLRYGLPLIIHTNTEPVFLLSSGGIAYHDRPDLYRVTDEDIQKSFQKICGYSVHSYQNEIKNGFMTINGHRIGFCGTAVSEYGKIEAVRKITSINVRIARQILGAADPIVDLIRREGMGGILIVGSPATGKTTMLKDCIRQLANGGIGRLIPVSVIDERGELGGGQTELGYSSDIFTGYPKEIGIEIAIRTMSPEVIVCDEIGNREDVRAISRSVNAGVTVMATMHARDEADFLKKADVPLLMRTGAFRWLVFLKHGGKKGCISHIYKSDMLFHAKREEKQDVQDHRNAFDRCGVWNDGDHSLFEFVKTSE